MDGVNILGFIISILTTAAAIWGMQCKKMKYVITGQLVSNGLLGLQYVLEQAWSAAYTLPFAIALSIISLVYTEKGKRLPGWVIKGFIAAFALVIVIPQLFSPDAMGRTPVAIILTDVLMFAALCFFVLSITSTASYKARICSATNCLLWLIYDILNAPSAILTHGVLLAFIAVGIIRLDRAEWKRIFASLGRGKQKAATDGTDGDTAVKAEAADEGYAVYDGNEKSV